MPEASRAVLDMQRNLSATDNLLKSARGLYKCLKPSQTCFKLSETSKTILKVSRSSKCYWQPPKSCQRFLHVS